MSSLISKLDSHPASCTRTMVPLLEPKSPFDSSDRYGSIVERYCNDQFANDHWVTIANIKTQILGLQDVIFRNLLYF